MTDRSLPVVDPDQFPRRRERTDVTIEGVVLAAGESTRYGEENKLLATLDGTPIVRHAVETLLRSSVHGVTVVVGHDRERVEDALTSLDITTAANENYGAGQSTSVQTGILAAREREADAALVALGDMPAVDKKTIDLLVTAYERGVGDIVAAGYDGQRGNPVLFDSRFFGTLTDIRGDTGGREVILQSDASAVIDTGDPGVLQDIDRPSDRFDPEDFEDQ